MAKLTHRTKRKIRTTISLPEPVYEAARSLVDSHAAPGASMNAFFEAAVTTYLKQFKRKEIDAEFAAMASDAAYHGEVAAISEEFSQSDWEAFEKFA
jgi:hypothetical protein